MLEKLLFAVALLATVFAGAAGRPRPCATVASGGAAG